MSKLVRLFLPIAVCLLLAGCAPQDSLFPLFLKSDQVFEEGILGEWIVQGGTQEIKPDEKSGQVTFQRGAEDGTYDIAVLLDIEAEDGATLASTGKLVHLGSYLFIDLSSPDLERRKNAIVPYPILESHVFGRVQLERDKMRIDFLSDKWVSDQAKAGKLAVAAVRTPNSVILSASTEELRKFALDHADDKDAFSESFAFQRKK